MASEKSKEVGRNPSKGSVSAIQPIKIDRAKVREKEADADTLDTVPVMTCSRCFERVVPLPDRYPTWKTHALAVLLFFIGLPFCVYLPYCYDCFGINVLRCPKCGCYLNLGLRERADPEEASTSK